MHANLIYAGHSQSDTLKLRCKLFSNPQSSVGLANIKG